MTRRLVVFLLAAIGCGTPARLPAADAGTDAGIDVADDCAWQPATLDQFRCAATYAGAREAHACAPCGSWLAVSDRPSPYEWYDCYYDAQSGALVGAFSWRDDGPCLVAGVGHDTCRSVAYPPCGDGGAP